jgi:predicted esterase
MTSKRQTGPHQGQPLLREGTRLDKAHAAVLMLHGRGSSAEDILSLMSELQVPGFAYVAPQAASRTWYPNSFLVPLVRNEPYLSSALEAVDSALEHLEAHAIPPEYVILLGFSQGGCLALEFAARNARRYGGIVGFSGGLIGDETAPRDYPGSFDGTPVFLGCSDSDPHVPRDRVEHTAGVLGAMGASVTTRIYPQMGHTIIEDELSAVREMMAALVKS